MDRAKETGEAGVYLFELNDDYDIDGNVPWNTARLMNHSCEPNVEAHTEAGRIWFVAVKDIKDGDELVFNYGFDLENYEEHPCLCGKDSCVGYIVGEEYWDELKKLLAKKKKKESKQGK